MVKKYIKEQKLRDLSEAQLREKVREFKAQQFQYRFDLAIGRLKNYSQIERDRRRLAAVNTLLRQIEKDRANKEGQG